jgi:hypothetical protein
MRCHFALCVGGYVFAFVVNYERREERKTQIVNLHIGVRLANRNNYSPKKLGASRYSELITRRAAFYPLVLF